MATEKSKAKKTAKQKTIVTKIAGQVGHLAGEFIAGKDHLMKMAGKAIDSVKSTILDIGAKEKTAPEKKVKVKAKQPVAKSARPAIKKVTKPVAEKKSAPLKKVIKKSLKKTASKK